MTTPGFPGCTGRVSFFVLLPSKMQESFDFESPSINDALVSPIIWCKVSNLLSQLFTNSRTDMGVRMCQHRRRRLRMKHRPVIHLHTHTYTERERERETVTSVLS
jgi:hypothetical protein